MVKKFLKLFFVLFFFVIGGLFTIYSIVVIIDDDLEFGDSLALFGGGEERGYGSAGYLISYDPGGGYKTCGFASLGPTIGITAGHCLDDTARIEVGVGDFSLDGSRNLTAIRGIQKEGWAESNERANDFSLIIYNAPEGYFNQFANIGNATPGCDYRVVAYGQTESNDGSKPRKSAQVCFSEVSNQLVRMYPDASNSTGICFGDSGSPVYREDTNEVVGIVVSIINDTSTNPTSPCSFNNEALVVRTDFNSDLINETRIVADQEAASDTSTTDVAITQIDTARESFLEKIGIGDLDEQDLWKLAIAVSGGAALFILFITLIIYYKD